jgi:hypothetical protein
MLPEASGILTTGAWLELALLWLRMQVPHVPRSSTRFSSDSPPVSKQEQNEAYACNVSRRRYGMTRPVVEPMTNGVPFETTSGSSGLPSRIAKQDSAGTAICEY